jgi:hypothetical protein
LVNILAATWPSCPAAIMKTRTLLLLFPLPFILLLSVECFDLSCATFSDTTTKYVKSSLNRRSPFLVDSFPDEASVDTLIHATGFGTYNEPDPKVYGITLTRKGGGAITTVALKGWIHVVFNLPNRGSSYVASTVSYLQK